MISHHTDGVENAEYKRDMNTDVIQPLPRKPAETKPSLSMAKQALSQSPEPLVNRPEGALTPPSEAGQEQNRRKELCPQPPR
jgi:hypothetical protein